jgi:hypothetical protein
MSAVPTILELSRLRSKLYGLRVADDPQHPASFVAICPQHRVLSSSLTLEQARSACSAHLEQFHPNLATLDPDA